MKIALNFCACFFLFLFPTSLPCQEAPSYEPGKWLNIQLALVSNRLVVYVADDGGWYYKAHDVMLSNLPPDGHISFQHEEHGNAAGTRFDNVTIWNVEATFDMDVFASPVKRRRMYRPRGDPVFVTGFTKSDLSNFVPVHGNWQAQDDYLSCPGSTDEWARIRTANTHDNFLLSLRLYRQPSNTTNWAGVALRTSADAFGGYRLLLLTNAAGNHFAVYPLHQKQIEEQNSAVLANLAMAENEKLKKLKEARASAAARYSQMQGRKPDVVGLIGEPTRVGDIEWTVTAVSKPEKVLKSDNQFINDLQAGGQFVRLHLRVENKGKRSKTCLAPDIFDDKGRRYHRSTDADLFIPANERVFLTNLNPNVPVICSAIYDIAADATHLSLLVGDLDVLGNAEGAIGIDQ